MNKGYALIVAFVALTCASANAQTPVAVGDEILVGSACTARGHDAAMSALERDGVDAAIAEFDRQVEAGQCARFPVPVPASVLAVAAPIVRDDLAAFGLRIGDDMWTVYFARMGTAI